MLFDEFQQHVIHALSGTRNVPEDRASHVSFELKEYSRIMASERKKSNGSKQAKDFNGAVEWNNQRLSDVEWEEFDKLDVQSEGVAFELLMLSSLGYAVSVGFDASQRSYRVTVVARRDGQPDFGRGYSCFSDDLTECAALAVFKLHAVYGGVIPPAVGGGSRRRG